MLEAEALAAFIVSVLVCETKVKLIEAAKKTKPIAIITIRMTATCPRREVWAAKTLLRHEFRILLMKQNTHAKPFFFNAAGPVQKFRC